MKNFYRLSNSANTGPVLDAVIRKPELWGQNTLRSDHPLSPHKDVQDIWLWFNDIERSDILDDIQTVPYKAWGELPQIRPIIFDLMRRVEAVQLGRCVITKLPPGKKIGSHVDQGAPATFYNRFQICLQSAPGCNFHIGDEQVCFKPGEVWMINNKEEHSVINNSKEDRIVIVVDLRCA